MAWVERNGLLLLGLAGSVGAVLRYLVGIWLFDPESMFPWSTWWCNVLGAFGLGMLRLARDGRYGPSWASQAIQRIIGTGFFGAFTTFSAIGLETIVLIKQNQFGIAFIYVMSGWLAGWLMVMLADRFGQSSNKGGV